MKPGKEPEMTLCFSRHMRRYRKLCTAPEGTVLIMVAFLVPIFIMLTGMITDIGRAFVFEAELNRACMIASEEAAKQIDISIAETQGENVLDDSYEGTVKEYFARNIYSRSAYKVKELGYEVTGGISNPRYIKVRAAADVDCFFLRIIGIDIIEIKTEACGRLRSLESQD